MKKVFILMAFCLLIPAASAKLMAEDILINRIRLGDYGYVTKPEMESYVYVYNNHDRKLSDVRVSLRILDADIYDTSGEFDLKKKSGAGKTFYTPINGIRPGEYLVRIVVSSGDVKRVKHRYIYVS